MDLIKLKWSGSCVETHHPLRSPSTEELMKKQKTQDVGDQKIYITT